MVEYFRRRAAAAGAAAGVVSLVGIFVLADDADYLFHGLKTRALPLVILSGSAASPRCVLLARHHGRGTRGCRRWRWTASSLAWGVAQWDYLLPTSLTFSAGAAPDRTITAVLVATGLAMLLLGLLGSPSSTRSTRRPSCPRRACLNRHRPHLNEQGRPACSSTREPMPTVCADHR